MIRFRCGSLASFDPVSQRYATCEHVLECEAAQAGQAIECPICGNEVLVPFPSAAGQASKAESHAPRRGTSQSPDDAPPTERRASRPAASAAPISGESNESQTTHPPTTHPPTTSAATGGTLGEETVPLESDELALAPPEERSAGTSSWAATDELDAELLESESRPLEFRQFTETQNCSACGAYVPNGQTHCPTCGVARRRNVDERPMESFVVQPAGLQRWLLSIIDLRQQTKAVQALDLILIVALTVVFVPVMMLAFGILGTLVALLELAAAAGYIATVFRLKQMAKQPGLPLAPWQRFVWNQLVPVMRRFNWPLPHAASRKVLDLRGHDLRGLDLLSLDGVREAEVLDLENARVTDDELASLHYGKHLKAIALIDTQVTHEGAFRLQQAIPPAWIWY